MAADRNTPKDATLSIRDANDADLTAIREIYGHHVRTGAGSFEETPPDPDAFADRYADLAGKGLPYLVAETAEGLAGFAYAGPFRPRAAYRFTVEDSIYVAPDRGGQGIGRSLLTELIARCTALGYRQMVAVIGDSANAGSIGLHRSLGFRMVGTLDCIGHKHGRWVDLVLMQRPLGDGDAPLETGLPIR